jgi:hypothetical protein
MVFAFFHHLMFVQMSKSALNNHPPVCCLGRHGCFIYEDEDGKQSTTMIEDWEVGVLFWNCLKQFDGDEQKACNAVKNKYFYDFAKTKDLHFFLGTSQVHHFTGRNPFLIIGTFHPKHISQLSLF